MATSVNGKMVVGKVYTDVDAQKWSLVKLKMSGQPYTLVRNGHAWAGVLRARMFAGRVTVAVTYSLPELVYWNPPKPGQPHYAWHYGWWVLGVKPTPQKPKRIAVSGD